MSSGAIAFPEWLNANSLRAYPIVENSSRTSSSGAIQLPDTLVVDARINIPFSKSSGVLYISKVEALPDYVTVTISYYDGSSSVVASVSVEVSSHTRNKGYTFSGAGTNHAILGVIVLGELNDVLSKFQGSYTFDQDSTALEPAVINISQPMIEYVSLIERGQEIAKLDRIVKLKAGGNVRLTRVDAETIRIDGISGENLDDCPAEPETPPILTINGAPPDDDGNVQISGSECISVVVKDTHILEFRDLCSSSCCGCKELQTLISSLESLNSQQASLREMVYRAYNEQSNMIANLTAYLRP